MLVFGTRPEAIKMAPLYHALKANVKEFETSVCVTAQHRQMLDQVLDTFEIKPDIDLNLMKKDQDLSEVTSSVLLGMRDVLAQHKYDAILVHGDTTTTLATAIGCFYTGVPIGHVEAGLRTHNLYAPFPEEFNRQIVSKVARWHFTPTELGRKNLLDDQVQDACITITGNTVVDALLWCLQRLDLNQERKIKIESFLFEKLQFCFLEERFALITCHRRENFGKGFLQICQAIKELAKQYPKIHFVCPVHLNHNVRTPLLSLLTGINNIHLIEPLDYEPFIFLMKHCYLVLTDSGGIQEEAPSLGKPVLVMRDATERPEGVHAGTIRLVGTNPKHICSSVSELLNNEEAYKSMASRRNPYGDGNACERIIDVLRTI